MSDLTTKDALLERAVAALEKLKDGINVINPAGVVQAFAGTTVPDGWLLCDGSAVSRTTYADLYAVIGDTYGDGDGSTTFNLPDLTDKFVQGSATAGTAKAAGLPNITGSWHTTSEYDPYFTGTFSGAFKTIKESSIPKRYGGSTGSYDKAGLDFDASLSNSIYGNSTTVQPPALTMQYIIKC